MFDTQQPLQTKKIHKAQAQTTGIWALHSQVRRYIMFLRRALLEWARGHYPGGTEAHEFCAG